MKEMTRNEKPAQSLKGFNARWTKRIFGYSGGSIVTEMSLTAARMTFAAEEVKGKDSFEPGTEYSIVRHVQPALILGNEFFTFDAETREIKLVARILKRDPRGIFPGEYEFI